MSLLKAEPYTPPHGEPDFVARPEKDEVSGSEEQAEISVAPTLTAEQETKLWRKIDLRLIPVIATMCFFTSADGGNIGNARLEGLMTQLNLTGNKYNIALMMYFIPFCFCQLPSNLVIQVIRPSRWLPGIMVVWGLVMMVMGFVKTYPQLVGLRVCLGAAEAGLYPGVTYYLTMWYPKYKYQYRIALFSGATMLAGAFSGFVTSLINSMNGYGGLEAWSWIFIMAGIATMLAGFIAALVMVDYPSTAKFLTAEERSFVIQKRASGATQDEDHHAAQQVRAAFTDWQVWALATILLSVAAPVPGIAYFLPTLINDLGYSTTVSQLLTIPPYVIATIIIVLFAHYSDKLKLRSPFIFVAQLITLTGYSINISGAPSHVKYFGLCLCLIGSSGSTGTVTWLANNLGGKYKRGAGIALQVTVGTLAGVISSMIFRIQDRPRYLLGNGLEIMFLGMGLVTVPITVLAYKLINAQRDREELLNQQQGVRTDPKEGDKPMGDRAPSFRYTI
ncbi:MFS general substrate transporter [Gyrodon lividus]|nr:MFS general substrate transporter [Gyrodon lividus]